MIIQFSNAHEHDALKQDLTIYYQTCDGCVHCSVMRMVLMIIMTIMMVVMLMVVVLMMMVVVKMVVMLKNDLCSGKLGRC